MLPSILRSQGSYEKLPLADVESRASREASEEGSLDVGSAVYQRQRRWPSCGMLAIWLIAQGLFLVAYTNILLRFVYTKPSYNACPRTAEDVVISPAVEAVYWGAKMLDTRLKQQSVYIGEPTESLDEAWADLLSLSNIKVHKSELVGLNKTSIDVPDENDMVWVTLGVNHELHCLNRLRQTIYPDYYFPDMTESEIKLNQMHSAHCVEYLRQAAMCHGDVSLTTYDWRDGEPLPVANFNTPHACVNWDALAGWQKQRVFNPMKPGWLKHPVLGPAFPDGNGSFLGVAEGHFDRSVKLV